MDLLFSAKEQFSKSGYQSFNVSILSFRGLVRFFECRELYKSDIVIDATNALREMVPTLHFTALSEIYNNRDCYPDEVIRDVTYALWSVRNKLPHPLLKQLFENSKYYPSHIAEDILNELKERISTLPFISLLNIIERKELYPDDIVVNAAKVMVQAYPPCNSVAYAQSFLTTHSKNTACKNYEACESNCVEA